VPHVHEVSLHAAVQHVRSTYLLQSEPSALANRLGECSWGELTCAEDERPQCGNEPVKRLTACEAFRLACSLFFDHLAADAADLLASLLQDVYDARALVQHRRHAKQLLLDLVTCAFSTSVSSARLRTPLSPGSGAGMG